MIFEKFIALLLATSLLVLSSVVPDVRSSNLEKIGNDLCKEGLVDASTRTKDGSTYFFKGEYYWKYSSLVRGFSNFRLISDDWKGVQGPIDASFTWEDGSTFIFKGDKYWRLINKRVLPGYPRKINDGFKGIPNDIDAALYWSKTGFTYFFKGNLYWRYTPTFIVPIATFYPYVISGGWSGIPNNVDAALQWENNRTYFFKGPDFFEYDNNAEKAFSSYPQLTAKGWFDCDNQNKLWPNYERVFLKGEDRVTDALLHDITDLKLKIKDFSTEMMAIEKNTEKHLIDIQEYLKGYHFQQNISIWNSIGHEATSEDLIETNSTKTSKELV